MAVLCTQYMMMEVRYPLSAGNRHIQILYSVVEMHRDAIPEKGWVLVDIIGRGRIPKLSIHPYFFKFAIKRVCFTRVHRIAKLTY
jgi:hypothetical protein